MALTSSKMLPLGTPAPDFTLPGGDKLLSRDMCRGSLGLLVMFICNHCPYVQYIEDALLQFALDYRDCGIGMVAISANNAKQYPDDAPDKIAERVVAKNYSFPYLHDESQEVARAYDAVCTPDFFLFDADLCCVYRGRFDDSRPDSGTPLTGADLRAAMDALLRGNEPLARQLPSMGCNIKWRDSP